MYLLSLFKEREKIVDLNGESCYLFQLYGECSSHSLFDFHASSVLFSKHHCKYMPD